MKGLTVIKSYTPVSFIKRCKLSWYEKECAGRKYDNFMFYAEDGYVYNMNSTILVSILMGGVNIEKALKSSDRVKFRDAILACQFGGEVYLKWTYDDDYVGGYLTDNTPVPSKDIVLTVYKDGRMEIVNTDVMKAYLGETVNTTNYVPLDVWAKAHNKSVAAAKRHCQLGHIANAVKVSNVWFVPKSTEYPSRQTVSVDISKPIVAKSVHMDINS